MSDRPTDSDLRQIVMACDDRCDDPEMHDFYANGGGFVWKRPEVHRSACIEQALTVGLNRYPHNVIGVYATFRGRCLTLNWKGSRRPMNQRSDRCEDCGVAPTEFWACDCTEVER
jgi:hypothetical protein